MVEKILRLNKVRAEEKLENFLDFLSLAISSFSKGLHKFFLVQACPSPPTLYLETTSKISYSTTEPCEFVNWAVDKSSPPTSLMQLSHPRH